MFHVRDRCTGSLFDLWAYLGSKRRKLLDQSWAGLFRMEILPHLPVEAITAAFYAQEGGPIKPVRDGYGFRYTGPALRLAKRRAARRRRCSRTGIGTDRASSRRCRPLTGRRR